MTNGSNQDGRRVEHRRTVQFDENGKIKEDESVSYSHNADGKQYRGVTIGADGSRAVSETVEDAEGKSEFNRVETGSGKEAQEFYKETDKDGNVLSTRETTTNSDGSGSTTIADKDNVEGNIEDFRDGERPEGMVEMPEGGRGETERTTTQTYNFDGQGQNELTREEETYSQTSTDVKLVDASTGQPADGGELTQSVTRVTKRGEDGALQTTESSAQTAKVETEEDQSFSRTDTWDEAGSSTVFSAEGVSTGELGTGFNLYGAGGDTDLVSINGNFAPKSASEHYQDQDEIREHLGIPERKPRQAAPGNLDLTLSVRRDKDGNVISDSASYSTIDENGNGRSVTRNDGEDGVSWQYADYSNNGHDYQRQTVVEGTEISVLEHRRSTGPDGQFEAGTKVLDGGETVSESQASKRRVDRDELQSLREDGVISQEEFDKMTAGRNADELYTVETGEKRVNALTETKKRKVEPYPGQPVYDNQPSYVDVEELVRDESGKPVRQGSLTRSTSVSNDSGFSVNDSFDSLSSRGGGESERLEQHSVIDPNGDPPLMINTRKTVNSQEAESDPNHTLGNITVGADGKVSVNGQEMEEATDAVVRDITGVVGKSADGFSKFSEGLDATLNTSLTGNNFPSKVANELGRGANVLGVGFGALDFYNGVRSGDALGIAKGTLDVVGGLNAPLSIAEAAADARGVNNRWLSRAGALSNAASLARITGVGGAVLSLPGTIDKISNGATGYDRSSGWLSAGAAGLGVAGAVPTPASPFLLGGAAVLEVASFVTGQFSGSSTAPRDVDFLDAQ